MHRLALALLTALLTARPQAQTSDARWPRAADPLHRAVHSPAAAPTPSPAWSGRSSASAWASSSSSKTASAPAASSAPSRSRARTPTAIRSASPTPSTHAVAREPCRNLPYDPVKDFAPVSMIGSSPFVLRPIPACPQERAGAHRAGEDRSPACSTTRPPARPARRISPARCSRRWRGSSSPMFPIAAPRSRSSTCSRAASRCSSAPSRRR